jgi:translation initiation factor 1A
MVKNFGGNKAKKAKNSNSALKTGKRPILWAEDLQIYGRCERLLGDMRCNIVCKDGIQRICKIRGKMRRRVFINVGDVVLVALRDFQDDKGDVIHKYNQDEVRMLQEQGEYDPAATNEVVDKKVVQSMMDLIGEEEVKKPVTNDVMDDIIFTAL